jgi:hypothetical protein
MLNHTYHKRETNQADTKIGGVLHFQVITRIYSEGMTTPHDPCDTLLRDFLDRPRESQYLLNNHISFEWQVVHAYATHTVSSPDSMALVAIM